MKKIRVDIIIPLHRMHTKKFDLTYKSLLDAKVEDISFETIVVINGSHSTNTKSIYLDNSLKNNINILEFEEEKGGSAARNIGFSLSKTEIVIFLDADVIVPINFFLALKKYLEEMENDQSIAGFCPLFALNRFNETKLQKYENLEDIRSLNSYRNGKYIKLLQGFCIVVKSSVFREIGMFNEDFVASEDRELALRMVINNYKIICASDIEILHLNPSSFKNIIKRKRWHSIGNAQLAIAYPTLYNKTIYKRIREILIRPLQVGIFDFHSYLYYWFIMGLYTSYFYYFKEKFKRGITKKDRN